MVLQIESTYNREVIPVYGEKLNDSTIYKILYFVCLKSYNIIYMGWCLTSFVFLKYDRWMTVYGAVNYFGFIYMILWVILYKGYRHYKKSPRMSREKEAEAQTTH